MSRLALDMEHMFATGKPRAGVKYLTYEEYEKDGGSLDYVKHLAWSLTTWRVGKVHRLVMTKGWWWWRKFYKIWLLKTDDLGFEHYKTEQEARGMQMLKGYIR